MDKIIKEKWKYIPQYDGRYMISNLGRVMSLMDSQEQLRKNPIILSPRTTNNGYLDVCLHKCGHKKYITIHRLVALAFVDNPHNYPQVNHKDEDKTNNVYTNLEWCTGKYNSNYGSRNKKISIKRKNHINVSIPIVQMTISGEIIAEYPSMREAARINLYEQAAIQRCCRGKKKTYKGYKWEIKIQAQA